MRAASFCTVFQFLEVALNASVFCIALMWPSTEMPVGHHGYASAPLIHALSSPNLRSSTSIAGAASTTPDMTATNEREALADAVPNGFQRRAPQASPSASKIRG